MSESNNTQTTEPQRVQRFSINFRIQHIVVFTSTIGLIVTAVPMWLLLGKPGHIWLSQSAAGSFGDLEIWRLAHRVFGIMLLAVSVYHIFYLIFSREGRREFIELFPKIKDVTDVIHNVMYFLGLRKDRPRFGRFTYYEKFDYWAVYWGCVIMIGSGLTLMYPEFFARYLPAWFTYELSVVIHADEAMLCFLALFIWHFYNVHYNPSRFPGTMLWWHGKMTHEEMLHDHPLEYEKLATEAEVDDKNE